MSRALRLEYRLPQAEHDTMAPVVRGLTNPEIAHIQGLSVNTVRNRLAASFQKLGATRRAEAVSLLSHAASEPSREFSKLALYNHVLDHERVRVRRKSLVSGCRFSE